MKVMSNEGWSPLASSFNFHYNCQNLRPSRESESAREGRFFLSFPPYCDYPKRKSLIFTLSRHFWSYCVMHRRKNLNLYAFVTQSTLLRHISMQKAKF
jgi:hypothetical protein